MRTLRITEYLSALTFLLLPTLLPAEDIDQFTRDLDLSGFQLPARADREAPGESREIFKGWDQLPEALRTVQPDEESIHILTLPPGPFLAVPNPPHLPNAFRLLDHALTRAHLTPLAPLVILLHADDNISIGCRVEMRESMPLPLGTDLSPMPERRLLVIPVEADTARRIHPDLVAAAARLRQHARTEHLDLQTRELYLLPLAPNQILFGLLIQ